MNPSLQPAAVQPGRWLADEPMHAAIEVHLPEHALRMVATVTALEPGPEPVCTLTLRCQRGRKVLEFRASLRVWQAGCETPDLAAFLTHHVGQPVFRQEIVPAFLARMTSHGLL